MAATDNAPSPNIEIVREDKIALRKKGIRSPKVKDMPYWIKDVAQKTTYYFRNEETYRRMYARLKESATIQTSHPICSQNISQSAQA